MTALRLGVLFSATADYGVLGRDCRDGAITAIEDLRSEGSIAIEPVVADPAGSSGRYIELARRMLQEDGCRHVIGAVTSQARKDVIPVVEQHDAQLWYVCPYEGFEANPNVIYTGACPNQHLLPLWWRRRARSAATWTSAISPKEQPSIFRWRSKAVSSRSATRMRRRAMAKCAAPPSRARWTLNSRSIWSRGANLKSPRFSTPDPVTRHLDGARYEATSGVGPDLMTAVREAVSRMIDLLAAEHGLNPIDAYLLLSVCGDLRISEIVDQPNWIVSFYFPRIVFA